MSTITDRAEMTPEKVRLLRSLAAAQGISPAQLPIVGLRRSDEGFALSAAQRGMWFLHQMEDKTRYNTSWSLVLDGPLDRGALARALTAVVERHETLRSFFPVVDGEPRQRIAPPAPVVPRVADLGSLPPARREPWKDALVREFMRRPFDLETGPLFRALLIAVEPERHVLVAATHHIVSDGWSGGVFLEELVELYDAHAGGREPELPALRIQYVDYASWQGHLLASEIGEAQGEYWSRQLAGLSPVLPLPLDRPRTPASPGRGRTLHRRYRAGLGDEAQALADASRGSLFMVLLAAFATLIARYSGMSDVPIGSPVANRGRRELEGLIGYFVNTLVLRVDLEGADSFRALLARVRETTLEAFAHQDFPFDQLVERLAPPRLPGVMPLFQVAFMVQSPPPDRYRVGDLELEHLVVDDGTARLDLEVQTWRSGDRIESFWTYDTTLFDEDTVAAMADAFGCVLEQALAGPDAPLDEIELTSLADRRRLAEAWNRTGTPGTPIEDEPLQAAFARAARETPDAAALVCGDRRWSFADLHRRASHLARHLRSSGVGPDTVVAIGIGRRPELVQALLAVLEAGGAFLPLDPDYPAERLAFMLRDAGVDHLVTHGDALAHVPARPRHVIDLESELDDPPGAGNIPAPVSPQNLAYVIYTSGSTGVPKGVAIPHGGLSNLMRAQRRLFDVAPGDRVLQFAPASFDAFVWEVAMSLPAGAALHLAPSDDLRPGPPLEELLRARRITHATLPPTALRWLTPEGLPDLRTLVSAGEACPPAVVDTWSEALRFVNAYGPTEVTVCATAGTCRPDAPLTIGGPLDNMRAYVLDERQRPASVGVAGELVVGGSGLARGYLGRPRLTAERFVPSQFGPAGARLYRTGDLARRRADGTLVFVGRADHQVKIRGFRIEPGEIENVLAEHPAVRAAAVVVRPSEDARLVACLVPSEAGDDLLDTVRAWARERLPAHMVPALWTTVERLPRTPAGKVDRQALARLDPHREAAAGAARVRPRNPLEVAVADVWSEVLEVAEVGVHDNFFDLGGDSILSIRMIARLRERGLAATVEEAVRHQTVAELAPCCKPVTAADAGPVTGTLPPTPIQRWFLERHGAGSAPGSDPARDHFNQAVLLEVPASWSADRIGDALGRVESHHDALRLRWRPGDDVLEHAAPGEVVVEEHDFTSLADLAPDERAAAIEEVAERLHAGLDLERGPIARAALFRFPEGEPGRLLWVIHHLAVDAVSWQFLVADLVALCDAEPGAEVPLPAKTTSYRAWAERLAAHAASPAARRELDFWRDRSSDPVRWPEPQASPSEEGGTSRIALDPDDTDLLLRGLAGSAGSSGSSVEAALLTAVAAGFAAWSGESRLLVDLESHGRASLFPDVDLSRTVGWFTALHPVEIELADPEEPAAELEAVEATLRAVPNHGVGWGLLRYLCPEPSVRDALAALPAPRVSFNYQGRIDRALPASSVRLASEPAGAPWPPDATSPYDFEINAMVLDGRLEIEWRDTGRRYGEDVLRTLADATRAALDALAAGTETSTPIFCLPGGGGNPMYLHPLARRLRRLGAGRRFVTLPARGLDGRAEPHRTIEAMAADFLAAIRAEQPRGPYLLAGHSLGAWAAFHLAWLLRQEGEEVTGLIVFDTPAPLAAHRRERADHDQLDDGRWLGGIVKLIERVSGTEFPVPKEELVGSTIDDFVERFHGYLRDLNLLPPDADLAHAHGMLQVSKANTEAMLGYEAPPDGLDVPVELLRAEALHADDAEVMVVPPDDPLWGWSTVTTGATASRIVPGDHVTMFSASHIPNLARALEEVLRRLDLPNQSCTSPEGSTRDFE